MSCTRTNSLRKRREMSCTRTISFRGEMRAAMRKRPGPNLKTASSRLEATPRWTSQRASQAGLPPLPLPPEAHEDQSASAVPDFDGPKLGMEVNAEVHDVRRDKTEANQSAGLSGTMEVEHPRYRCKQLWRICAERRPRVRCCQARK